MLHEVLMTLSGHFGSLFTNSNGTIEVARGLDFLSPEECAMLGKFAALGVKYKRFMTFIDRYGSPVSFDLSSDELHGHFIKTFCRSLDEVLEDYIDAICSLEKEILADTALTLCYIYSKVYKFEELFAGFESLLNDLETQQAHGAYVLEVIYRHMSKGVWSVKSVMESILCRCNQLLYHHLRSWMLYGHIEDRYGEFFIGVSSGSPQPQAQEIKASPITHLTESQFKRLLLDQKHRDATAIYEIKADLLPTYISGQLAETLLFIGESVKMLGRWKEKHQLDDSKDGAFSDVAKSDFAIKLTDLSMSGKFDMAALESVILEIRTYIAKRLWIVIVKESHLIDELCLVKNMLLLGNGMLYQTFLERADRILRNVRTRSSEHDLNMILQHCASGLQVDSNTSTNKFKLTVSSTISEETKTKSKAMVWDELGVNYVCESSLNAVFTAYVLDNYKVMFKFLLRLVRTHQALLATWRLHKQINNTSSQSSAVLRLTHTRNNMIFLVSTFQSYMQVDVIESLFASFISYIKETEDIERVKVAHEQFMSNLIAYSFINFTPVAARLNEILSLCDNLSALLLSSGSFDIDPDQAERITTNFERESSLLFQILSSGQTYNLNKHLSQLLMRLDYNRYYSATGSLS